MKKLISIPVILLAALFLNACKFLDETPKVQLTDETLFKNLSDYEAALIGIYQGLAGHDQPTLGSAVAVNRTGYTWGFWVLQQLGNDDLIAALQCNAPGNQPDMAALDAYNLLSTNNYIYGAWAGMYVIINRANDLIGRIEALPDYPDIAAGYQAIEGQARFLRAFCYYQLVTIFGGIPMPTTVTTAESIKQRIPRSPVKDVYALMISDLQKAYPITPKDYNTDGIMGKATKWSVAGLLARVNLVEASMARHAYKNMNGEETNIELSGINSFDWVDQDASYKQARAWADTVINQGFGGESALGGMVYRNAFFPYENGPEILFDIQFANGLSQQVGGWNGFWNVPGSNTNSCAVPATMAFEMRPGGDGNTKYSVLFPISGLQVDGTVDYAAFKLKGDVRKEKTVGTYGNPANNSGFLYPTPGAFSGMATNGVANPPSTWTASANTWNTTTLADANRVFMVNKYYSFGQAATGGLSPVNLPMMRLSEMYLIYAEAEAEINGGVPTPMAYAMINDVRHRAAATNILPDLDDNTMFELDNAADPTGTSASILPVVRPIRGINVAPGDVATQFRLAIMQERKWEFVGESMRKVDLIRSGWMKYYIDEMDFDNFDPAGRMHDTKPNGRADLRAARNFKWSNIFLPIPFQEISSVVPQNYSY